MMDIEKIKKETKMIMIVTLVTGLFLLAAGISLRVMNIQWLENNRAVVGLSFIPLSVAVVYYFKLARLNKSPDKMRETLLNEMDERLASLRNEADAKAFKVIQGSLFLAYMGYTLIVPEDIFESVGWWILLALMVVSFMVQGIFNSQAIGKDTSGDGEE